MEHTHDSIDLILSFLISFKFMPQAQFFTLQLLSGRIKSSSPLNAASIVQSFTKNYPISHPICVHLQEIIFNAYVEAKLPEEALKSFIEMINHGSVPRLNLFNSLLILLLESNHLEKGWWVFNEFKGKVELDVYSFGIMIKGFCQGNDLERAFNVLDGLDDVGMSPNVVIYTTLIDGCCKNSDIAKAKDLFNKMEELGLVANQHTYTVLMNGLFKKGLKKEGFQLYEKMKDCGILPNIYTYNSMMNEHCKDGLLGRAFLLFDEMVERGLACNIVTYNI
uniref:Pentatricopeptide repeat-containing protein n=1 Tax=Chenopodium quinoa TaxID=63459 RepID=A0A803LTT7_CHEQI